VEKSVNSADLEIWA